MLEIKPDAFFTVEEACRETGMGKKKLLQAIRSGNLKAKATGARNGYLIKGSNLHSFLCSGYYQEPAPVKTKPTPKKRRGGEPVYKNTREMFYARRTSN